MGGASLHGMAVLTVLAALLSVALLGGLVRVVRGPSRGDRMLAAQLFGTTGVALLLVMAEALEAPSLRDVALVFAVLAPINTAVFLRHGVRRTQEEEQGPAG
jgi:multicomponent Na+:H+ antiporter subunit F